MITPERLAQIEAEANAATEGPWGSGRGYVAGLQVFHTNLGGICCMYSDKATADATFIANARQNIPDLVAEVRRLQAESARAMTMATDYQALAAQREDEISALRASLKRADEDGAAAIERTSSAIIADKWNVTAEFQARALKAEAEVDRLKAELQEVTIDRDNARYRLNKLDIED